MAQDTQIESCNKKLKEAAEMVSKSRNRILSYQRPATTSRQHIPTDEQRRLDLLEKAKKTQQRAVAKLSDAMAASTSLLETGSGKVVVKLPIFVHT